MCQFLSIIIFFHQNERYCKQQNDSYHISIHKGRADVLLYIKNTHLAVMWCPGKVAFTQKNVRLMHTGFVNYCTTCKLWTATNRRRDAGLAPFQFLPSSCLDFELNYIHKKQDAPLWGQTYFLSTYRLTRWEQLRRPCCYCRYFSYISTCFFIRNTLYPLNLCSWYACSCVS